MKDVNINKVSEGLDYELIPVDVDNDQAWDVRILRGQFPETVLRYGKIRFDGERDCLTFNFTVIDSPDDELTSGNHDLQDLAGDILEDVLERAYNEGWMVTGEDKSGNKSRTDDTEEPTD
jgi:hypothetical protein